jgi:hypothetical protein
LQIIRWSAGNRCSSPAEPKLTQQVLFWKLSFMGASLLGPYSAMN